jgi:hypothetical protein
VVRLVDGSAIPVIDVGSDGAFGDRVVASIDPKAGLLYSYKLQPQLLRTEVTAAGTATYSSAGYVFGTALAVGDAFAIESRRVLRYVPGIGVVARFAPVFNGQIHHDETGTQKALAGIGNAENGYFLGWVNGKFSYVRRKGSVDTVTPYDSFNVDPLLNGHGQSGVDYAGTKPGLPNYWHESGVPMAIRFQYLGFGQIELMVESQKTGRLETVHTEDYSGTVGAPSVLLPHLRARIEGTRTADGTGGLIMLVSSMGLHNEGKVDDDFYATEWSESNVISVTTTELPIISFRNETSFNSQTNMIPSLFKQIGVAATVDSGAPRMVTFRAYRGSTTAVAAALTGEAFAAVHADSVMSIDTTATAVNVAGLTKVWEHRLPVPGHTLTEVVPDIDLVPDESIIFTGQLQTGTGNADMGMSARWLEQN